MTVKEAAGVQAGPPLPSLILALVSFGHFLFFLLTLCRFWQISQFLGAQQHSDVLATILLSECNKYIEADGERFENVMVLIQRVV